MVSVQPIQLWRYLGFKKNNLPFGIKRLFYLSWEDAFWDLLINKKIPKNSTILLPEFYCLDVESNIRFRGYKIIRYPILKNLSVDKKIFLKLIKENQPEIVIVFHPVGILSNLFKNTDWVNYLKEKTILIEDSVHRIVNPNKIKLLKTNHFVIDSLRKVIPMQGANIFGSSDDLDYKSPGLGQSLLYSVKAHYLWLKMVVCWNLGFYKEAEELMISGYDLIGNELMPARGLLIFKYLFNFIDYEKIYTIKKRQIEIYKKYFKNIIKFDLSDEAEMRGFPLVLENKNADKVLDNLVRNKLRLRFELTGSEWSKKRKIMYLPVGPYLSDSQIESVSALVLKSL